MPADNLTFDQFRALSETARVEFCYSATSAQINAVHDGLVAAGWNPVSSGPSILSLACDGARAKLRGEITQAQAELAATMQTKYRQAKGA